MDIDHVIEKLSELCGLTEDYNPSEKYKQENPGRYMLGKALYAPIRTLGQGAMYIAKAGNALQQTKPMKKLGLLLDDPGGRHRKLSTALNATPIAIGSGIMGAAAFPKTTNTILPLVTRTGKKVSLNVAQKVPSAAAGIIAGTAGAALGGYLAYNRDQYKKRWTEKERQAAEKRYFDEMKRNEKTINKWLDSYSDDMRKTYKSR